MAPLGRAVIGGLVFSTFATLLVLPAVFAVVQRRSNTLSVSLYPFDPASRHYQEPTPLVSGQPESSPNPHAAGIEEQDLPRS
jgi:hypothetical protein